MVAVAAIIQMVETEAAAVGVDPYVILGIMKVESAFRPNAMHYDEKFKKFSTPEVFAKAEGNETLTEEFLQKFSYGLLQIEGATLRWLGLQGPLIFSVDPKINIHYGIKFFKLLTTRYIYLTDQIAAYNWGHSEKKEDGTYANQPYVDKVLAAIDEVKSDLATYSLVN